MVIYFLGLLVNNCLHLVVRGFKGYRKTREAWHTHTELCIMRGFNKSAPKVDVGMCLVNTLHASRSLLKHRYLELWMREWHVGNPFAILGQKHLHILGSLMWRCQIHAWWHSMLTCLLSLLWVIVNDYVHSLGLALASGTLHMAMLALCQPWPTTRCLAFILAFCQPWPNCKFGFDIAHGTLPTQSLACTWDYYKLMYMNVAPCQNLELCILALAAISSWARAESYNIHDSCWTTRWR